MVQSNDQQDGIAAKVKTSEPAEIAEDDLDTVAAGFAGAAAMHSVGDEPVCISLT